MVDNGQWFNTLVRSLRSLDEEMLFSIFLNFNGPISQSSLPCIFFTVFLDKRLNQKRRSEQTNHSPQHSCNDATTRHVIRASLWGRSINQAVGWRDAESACADFLPFMLRKTDIRASNRRDWWDTVWVSTAAVSKTKDEWRQYETVC